jgi:hypothetical protein
MNEPRMRTVLLVAAAYHLVLGAFMFFAPGAFYDSIGKFSAKNPHYIKDVSTFYIALGAVFWAAVHRPSWRVPLLVFTTLAYALHTLNHLIDVGKAATPARGWFSVFSLGLLTAAFAFLLGAAARGVREAKPARERGRDREREPEPEPEPLPEESREQ